MDTLLKSINGIAGILVVKLRSNVGDIPSYSLNDGLAPDRYARLSLNYSPEHGVMIVHFRGGKPEIAEHISARPFRIPFAETN